MSEQPQPPESEQPQPPDEPMNRAERRHLAKHGNSPDVLHDFRARQQNTSPNKQGPIPPPMKRGAVHRKTGS